VRPSGGRDRRDGTVLHSQSVEEIAEEPDYDAAMTAPA